MRGGELKVRVKARLSRVGWRTPLALFVLATLAFELVLDFRIILPKNLAWIFAYDADPAGYYLASAYYRNATWSFPITHMENMLHPVGASFAMMDAVPLAGILTKLFSFALPDDFQYLGLWLYSCVLLNAVFGYLVLGRLVEDRALRWAGTCLITFAPPLVTRFVHTALATHWLLLAAFWTVLEDRTLPRKRLWTLAALSWFISPVLMVMVNAILVGVFWVHRRERRQVVIAALGWVLALVASAALLGYFNLRESTAKLHPFYFSDLTSLVSSYGTSSIVPSLPTRWEPGENYAPWALGENFAYLGLGGILLFLALVADTVARGLARDPRRLPSAPERAITLSCLVMAGYAVSPSPHVLGEVWDVFPALTRLLEPVLNRLRVPARFLWPLFYYVLVFGTRAAERWLARLARPLVSKVAVGMLVALQAADLGPWLLAQGRNPAFLRPPPLPTLPPFLASRWTPRTRFMIFDPPIQRGSCSSRKERWSDYDERSFALALFGIKHRLITNTDFRISARLSKQDLERVCRYGDEVNRSQRARPSVMIVTTADQHR